jgi:hypothetical protein
VIPEIESSFPVCVRLLPDHSSVDPVAQNDIRGVIPMSAAPMRKRIREVTIEKRVIYACIIEKSRQNATAKMD